MGKSERKVSFTLCVNQKVIFLPFPFFLPFSPFPFSFTHFIPLNAYLAFRQRTHHHRASG